MTLTWSGVRPADHMITSKYQTNAMAQPHGQKTWELEILLMDIAVT